MDDGVTGQGRGFLIVGSGRDLFLRRQGVLPTASEPCVRFYAYPKLPYGHDRQRQIWREAGHFRMTSRPIRILIVERSVSSKLGVHSKLQALLRARELALID